MKAFSTALSLLLLAAGLSKQLVSATADFDAGFDSMNQISFEDQANLARSYPTNIKFKTIRNYCGAATQVIYNLFINFSLLTCIL
jgi:hypothetical protein